MKKILPIIDYINEFKYRLIYILSSIIFVFIICYTHCEELLYIMSKSLDQIYNNKFIYTSITEVLNTKVSLSIYISIYIGLFIIIYNLFLFLYPGLYSLEIKRLFLYTIVTILILIINIYLVYKKIIPFIYEYLLKNEIVYENKLFHLKLTAKISEFCINYMIIITIMTFISFLPLLSIIIYKMKIVNSNLISQNRDFIYIIILLIVSFVTPSELYLFILTLLLMVMFYEFFIYFFFLFHLYKYFIFFKNI